ncbi:glycosyltransferase [Chishuiella sp.]|uniref:glycosyltransferase n=1 Tax=Chishuiella sp. TaxID=1969467 RepID=UPI0028AB4D75|nr:glycosyltransferase [Chishuiella sp.]
MNKVSVIVLVYNQEDFIEKNLQGVFMQKTNFPIELIISNDKSTDNTNSIIQKLIENAPEHIEINYTNHKNNLGATPNFYDALKKVTGKYIAFCEGDDYWTDENKLQIQYDFLEQNKDYAICCHNVIQVDENDIIINNSQFSSIENRDYTAFEIYKNWQVHTTSIFMKSSVLMNEAFRKTLNDPTLLYFDTIMFMAATTSGKMRGMDITMSAYRRHSAGLSAGTDLKRDLRHNKLDQITGNYYKGKISHLADWMIFSRSRLDFWECIKNNKYSLALQHLKWILKKYKILRIYLLKKIK